ncbi:MAG: helix-turn-helix domain-containing protein [Granulosicoccaceae bacterium]
MEQKLSGEVFDLLKRALKAQGMSYERLADELQLSLPTIKRLFAEKDCKFSRLLTICDVLDISFADLMDTAKRNSDSAAYLPPEVEAAFARYPQLLNFYTLLREPQPPEAIAAHYGLTDADIELYLRDLEALALITRSPGGRVGVRDDAPFKVHRDGPLQAAYSALNQEFIALTLQNNDTEDFHYDSLSRQMRPETAAQVSAEIEQLKLRIGRLARQDKLISKLEEMKSYKWSFASAQVSLLQFLSLDPHRDRRTAPNNTRR